MAEYPFKDLLPLDEVLEQEGYYKDWTHLDPEVFYSLTQISEYIKTKGYGVDVRLLIAQLAEHFGLKTTQVVDLANLLQQKFENLEGVTQSFTDNINSLVAQMEVDKNTIVANATVDSEVILSRGGFDTLGERLNDTTAQLAQTENEVIDVKNSNSKQVASINNLISSSTSTFNEPLVTVTNALNDVKKHVAFPTMAIDGNNILVMYRRGTNHIDTPDGILVQKKSADGGATWGAEEIVYTPPLNFDARDPNIMQLSATKLLLIYPLVENTGQIKSVENEVWVSNDFGTTWTKIGKLPKRPEANWYQIIRGSMTRTSAGRILVPVWSADLSTSIPDGAFIVYSDDEGVNWSVGSWITQEAVTETAIEFDNFGRLYAVMRNDPTLAPYRENNMFINYSDDNGVSWSKPVELPLQGHAPHLLKLKDTILLTWRNTNKRHVNALDDRYSVNFCTLKNGAVNSQIYEMLNTGTPDCGYPWAVKNGSKVFVSFYVVMPSWVDIIYVKPLDLKRLENLEFIQSDPITYINAVNAKTEILKHKTIMGDNSISGNGTNLSSKFIPFGETVKGVKNVKVTVLNDTSVNFITTVSGVTTSGFAVNIKNLIGTFTSAVQIYWEVVVEYL